MSFTQAIKQYLTEHPETTDEELKKYIREYTKKPVKPQLDIYNPFYSPFTSILTKPNIFEHVSKMLDKEFNDFDLTQFDNLKTEPTDRGFSRSKTSYVHYNNGEKKKKTVEISQRYNDKGVMTMHKRKTIENQNGKTVEEYFPDGSKTLTQYNANGEKKALHDKSSK